MAVQPLREGRSDTARDLEDGRPALAAGPLSEQRVSQPAGGEAGADGHLQGREVPQRKLALELRFAIDRLDQSEIDRLVAQNPHNVQSKHVLHNLGWRRTHYLKATGRITDG